MTQPVFSTVDVNGVCLHIAEAGPEDGPLAILLHGFPEFWFGWRHQIAPLAEAGYHVVVPDQRGYNLSQKPEGIAAYDLDNLAGDVIGLADRFTAGKFFLAGHDWGSIVGWWTAQNFPQRVERFVALSAGHPAIWRERMSTDPEQRRKSRYVAMFQVPWLPEYLLRRKKFAALAQAIQATADPGKVTEADLAIYRAAWSQTGALSGGLNWYRAIYRRRFPGWEKIRISVPTRMVWGMRDLYGDDVLARESVWLCETGELVRLERATHWTLQDEPERVATLLKDWFAT